MFTEYVDTQNWLAGLLGARGLGGDRLGLLYGGMDTPPPRAPQGGLPGGARTGTRSGSCLATDAASEGIDLQDHCCRVINYDIPFNPNRLEQRIGRVDRFGQRRPVHVGALRRRRLASPPPAGSYEADLEFLSRVAQKVAQEREDLGRVNPVLAQAVESRMLGRPLLDDPFATQPSTPPLRAERDLRDQVARLRQQLTRQHRRSCTSPVPNVRRVVDTALALAGQPPLVERPDGLIEPPDLTRGWERTLEGIEDPLDPTIRRPLTFDAERAGPDVVHAHLGWRLVDQAQRLLRSAVWGEQTTLARVAGVSAELPDDVRPGEMLVTVLTRFVLVGADGARLHEEVLLAARAVPRDRAVPSPGGGGAPLRGAAPGPSRPPSTPTPAMPADAGGRPPAGRDLARARRTAGRRCRRPGRRPQGGPRAGPGPPQDRGPRTGGRHHRAHAPHPVRGARANRHRCSCASTSSTSPNAANSRPTGPPGRPVSTASTTSDDASVPPSSAATSAYGR